MIQKTLQLIKDNTGLVLTLCDYFTGIKEYPTGKYFNIVLPEKTCESKDYVTLQRFSEKYGLIKVEPNGVRRVAIFFSTEP